MAAPALTPAQSDALQRAIRLHRSGQPAEAERAYLALLAQAPAHPQVENLLALALADQGRHDEARTRWSSVTSSSPDFAPAHCNLGRALAASDPAAAEASYRRALELEPGMLEALHGLATLFVDTGRHAESVPWFRLHAERSYGRGGEAPPVKQAHDREQREYLEGLGIDSFGLHLEPGERLPGRTVRPDAKGVAETWRTACPQVSVVDDLLTDDALEALRRYCYRSKIWQSVYANGYLGAMPEHGFACPLLSQIAEDLRAAYPTIVRDLPLLRWWAFRCGTRPRGIDIHADFAAVNVNFWITPDEANLDGTRGGLIVWDVPAPREWTMKEYNTPGAGTTIRRFLADANAKSVAVPYRANRAVIFDSDLFHETDALTFEEGYLCRRINVTMLFGRREDG